MKKANYILDLFLLLCVIIFFNGCATTPNVRIWRPWTRILELESSIPLNSKLNIKVQGDTKPLLGNDSLLQNEIEKNLEHLLERRGYKIVFENPDFFVVLKYITDRHDKLKSSSLFYSSTNSAFASSTVTGAGATSGLGVSIARSVSALFTQSRALTQNKTETVKFYTHIISIEILDKNKQILWQGDSSWDSLDLNLQTDIKPSIQLLLSGLPTNYETLPQAPEVKKGRENNFYKLMCKGYWFSCPSLPYKISFSSTGSVDSDIPYSVKNPEAFSAYIDLIQTAEYALPLGLGTKYYSDPLNRSLWSKVQLGGKYYLGSKKKLIKVLIKLKGERSGYTIDKCWIATDKEFENFENLLTKWRKTLIDYYDVYVH